MRMVPLMLSLAVAAVPAAAVVWLLGVSLSALLIAGLVAGFSALGILLLTGSDTAGGRESGEFREPRK